MKTKKEDEAIFSSNSAIFFVCGFHGLFLHRRNSLRRCSCVFFFLFTTYFALTSFLCHILPHAPLFRFFRPPSVFGYSLSLRPPPQCLVKPAPSAAAASSLLGRHPLLPLCLIATSSRAVSESSSSSKVRRDSSDFPSVLLHFLRRFPDAQCSISSAQKKVGFSVVHRAPRKNLANSVLRVKHGPLITILLTLTFLNFREQDWTKVFSENSFFVYGAVKLGYPSTMS